MNKSFNTLVNLNEKSFFTKESNNGDLGLRLFKLFSKNSKELVLNDDGGKLKEKIKKFDISSDKIYGNDWHFKLNNDSIIILGECLKTYLKNHNMGFLEWSIKGDFFSISYKQIGRDDIEYEPFSIFFLDGPNGKKTINTQIEIKSNKEFVPKFNDFFNEIK